MKYFLDVNKKVGEADANPDTVLKLIEALEENQKLLETIQLYCKSFPCDKNCDPLVDFHCPECCIERDITKSLAKIKEILG